MSQHENATPIDDQAACWAVRAERDDFDAADQAELDAWLAADRRRQGAFLRAQAGWSMLDRASALRGDQTSPASAGRGAAPTRRWIWMAGGGAAMAAGLGALAVLAPETAHYGAQLGEVRRVPLEDGSIAAINTDSALEVVMRPRLRQVRLKHGEAWFQVAKDRARPFVVAAGDVRVRAVGTAFSVRRLADGAEIQVTEGTVEAWSMGDDAHRILVTAGSKTLVRDSGGPGRVVQASAAIDRSLAWRSGQIILDGETLGEAATEFNRYNARKIVVPDADLAREPLVGRFRVNEPEAFARAAATTIGAKVEISEKEIRFE